MKIHSWRQWVKVGVTGYQFFFYLYLQGTKKGSRWVSHPTAVQLVPLTKFLCLWEIEGNDIGVVFKNKSIRETLQIQAGLRIWATPSSTSIERGRDTTVHSEPLCHGGLTSLSNNHLFALG